MTINFKHYCAVFFNPTDGLNEEVSKILNIASQEHIEIIDTARLYGDSEQVLGQYLSHHLIPVC